MVNRLSDRHRLRTRYRYLQPFPFRALLQQPVAGAGPHLTVVQRPRIVVARPTREHDSHGQHWTRWLPAVGQHFALWPTHAQDAMLALAAWVVAVCPLQVFELVQLALGLELLLLVAALAVYRHNPAFCHSA